MSQSPLALYDTVVPPGSPAVHTHFSLDTLQDFLTSLRIFSRLLNKEVFYLKKAELMFFNPKKERPLVGANTRSRHCSPETAN